MADVTIRRAKLEDKDDVMRIRDDVYAGRDYLLSFYETFVKVDNCFPFVAVIDNTIVRIYPTATEDAFLHICNRRLENNVAKE